ENFAGGRYKNPLIDRSSQLFQWTRSGSRTVETFTPPVSLSVQRSSLPVCVSSEYTSSGTLAELKLNPRSRLFLCQRGPLSTPRGSFGNATCLRVAVSSTCSTP